MKITGLFLFCLIAAAATNGCKATRLVSVNAENENASAAASPSQTAVRQSDQNGQSFAGGDAGETPGRGRGLTGIYEYKGGSRSNEIRVLQVGENVLKVSFLGNSEFRSQAGPMANSGVISARKVQLENGSKALLTSEDAPDCYIFLTFKGDRLEVKQNENDCGFPNGVSASGVYRRTSAEPPGFDFDEGPGDSLPEAILEEQTADTQGDAAVRIRFNAGESAAVVRGKISGGAGATYLIGARAGQTMAVKVTGGGANNDVVFDVVAPGGVRLGGDRMYDDWSRKLTKTGDYVIRVSALESQEADYKLQVSVR